MRANVHATNICLLQLKVTGHPLRNYAERSDLREFEILARCIRFARVRSLCRVIFSRCDVNIRKQHANNRLNHTYYV